MIDYVPLPSIDPVNKVPPIYGGPVPAVAIRKVGNYAEAVDLEKNTTIAHSTSHAEVFQKAIDYAEKGKVIVAPGEYLIDTPILIQKPIVLKGVHGGFSDLFFINDSVYYG